MAEKHYFLGKVISFALVAAVALMMTLEGRAGAIIDGDPVDVDPGYCKTARGVLDMAGTRYEECGVTESCQRILGPVNVQKSNVRTVDIGSPYLINNCASSTQTSSHSVSREFKAGFTRRDVWENSTNFSIGVSVRGVTAGLNFVTNIASEVTLTLLESTKYTDTLYLSAPPLKRVKGVFQFVLGDFEYTQDYQYVYSRTDANSNAGPGVNPCACHSTSGINCSELVSASGTISAAGTEIINRAAHYYPETDAENCGG